MTLENLWSHLWPSLALSGAPLLLAWLADKVFQSRAAVRSLRLRAALICALALAILPILPLQIPRPLWLPAPLAARPVEASEPIIALPQLPVETEPATPSLSIETSTVETQTPQIEAATPRKYLQRDSSLNWPQIATGIWLVGALLLLSWSAWCHAHIARLRGRSQVLADGELCDAASEIARDWRMSAPHLLQTPNINSPFAVGVWQGAICWPAHFHSDENASWRAILRHEMAHVRRRDCAWNAFAQIVRAVLWPQPLLWWACRAIRRNAEDVCDEAALENCAPTIYARGLLDLAQNAAASTCSATRAASAGALPSQPELSRRVAAILRPGARDAWRVGWRTRAATVAALSVVIGSGAVISCAPAPESKAAASNAEAVKAPVTMDLSTPQATLDTFIAAIKAGDAGALVTCMKTQNSAEDLKKFAHDLQLFGEHLTVSDWKISQQTSSATGEATMKFSPGHDIFNQRKEKLTLKKIAGQWKITPDEGGPQYSGTLADYVTLMSDPSMKNLRVWLDQHSKATIEGQVLLADGSPAAGASVMATMVKFPNLAKSEGIPVMSVAYALPQSVKTVMVSTDKNGKYRFKGLIGTKYSLSAYWPVTPSALDKARLDNNFNAKQIARAQEVKTQESATIQAAVLQMQPTVAIEVQTLDRRTGQPLKDLAYMVNIGATTNVPGAAGEAGQTIIKAPPGKNTLLLPSNASRNKLAAVTTSRGLYATYRDATVQLENGPQIPFSGETSLNVSANQPRKVTIRLASLDDLKASRIKPRLKAPANGIGTGVIAGRVQNADGSAAPNVQVTAKIQPVAQRDILKNEGLSSGIPTQASLQRKREIQKRFFSEQRAVSDNNGNFQLQGLITAPYDVMTGPAGKSVLFKPASVNGKVSVAKIGIWVEQGHTTQLPQPFVMTEGALIRGRITDDVNGESIGGVAVNCIGPHRPMNSGATAGVKTKPNGTFVLRVPAGTNQIYFAGPYISDKTKYQTVSNGENFSGYVFKLPGQRLYQGENFHYQLDGVAYSGTRAFMMIPLTLKKGETHTLDFQLQRVEPVK